jgi:hypothetical protein
MRVREEELVKANQALQQKLNDALGETLSMRR